MSQHLAFAKWRESAFSTDLLKGSRWLLGARPKGLPESLHEALVVTPESQTMLMQLHVKRFLQATRRVKPTQRGRARISPEEFDKLVDYSCMFAFLRQSAKTATSDPKVDEKLLEAFMARCLVGVWWLCLLINQLLIQVLMFTWTGTGKATSNGFSVTKDRVSH